MDGGSRAERPRRVPASQPSGGRTPPHTSAHRKKLGLQQHLHHLSRCTASSAPPSTPRGRGPSFIIAVSRLPVRLTCLASPRLALHHPCFVRRGIHHHHHYLPGPRRRPNSPRVYFPDAQQQHQAARFLMTTSDYPPRPSSPRLHLVVAPANTSTLEPSQTFPAPPTTTGRHRRRLPAPDNHAVPVVVTYKAPVPFEADLDEPRPGDIRRSTRPPSHLARGSSIWIERAPQPAIFLTR